MVRKLIMAVMALTMAGCLSNSDTSESSSSTSSSSIAVSMVDQIVPTEGSGGGTKSISVTFNLSQAAPKDLTYTWVTYDGTAVAPADYISATGTVTVPKGSFSGLISIQTVKDNLHEIDEIFSVVIVSGTDLDHLGSNKTAYVTITDDDAAPVINIASGSGAEESGIPLIVSLSTISGRDTTFEFLTESPHLGTATEVLDYVKVDATTYTIPAGQLSPSTAVVVQSIHDELNENNETVNVLIQNPVGATSGTMTAVATIQDVTGYPGVRFASVEQNAYESEVGSITVTVELEKISGRDVTVPIVITLDENAPGQHDADTAILVPVSIAAGTMTGSFSFDVPDDLVAEENKDIVFGFDPLLDPADLSVPAVAARLASGVQWGSTIQSHTVHIRESDTLPQELNDLVRKDMGIKLNGTDLASLAGARVCKVGDVNNDGYDDVMVLHRAVQYLPSNQAAVVPAQVFNAYFSTVYGDATNTTNLKLGSLLGSRGNVRQLSSSYKFYNVTDSTFNCDLLGDVTGTGKEAFSIIQDSSTTLVFDGRADITTIPLSNSFNTVADSGAGASSAGFKFYPRGPAGLGGSNYNLASGDFNGDGINDYFTQVYGGTVSGVLSSGLTYSIIGGPGMTNDFGKADLFKAYSPDAGYVPLVSNIQPYGLLRTWSDSANNTVGYRIRSVGDFDGDGIDDYLQGTTYHKLIYGSATAREFVIQTGSRTFEGGKAQGINFTTYAPHPTEKGTRGIGDFNGDGLNDLVIAVTAATSNIYIRNGFAGRGGTDDESLTANTDQIHYYNSGDDKLFSSITWAGDLNLDGYDDLVFVSRDDLDQGMGSLRGAVYVMWGADNSGDDNLANRLLSTLAQVSLPGSPSVKRVTKILGEKIGDVISEVDSAGDFNGDGVPDLIVGVANAEGANTTNSVSNAGAAYIIFGGDLTDSLSGAQTVSGGSSPLPGQNYSDGIDVYIGTAGDDRFFGAAGNDVFYNDGSNGSVVGGNDVIYGGTGDDDIYIASSSFRRIDGGKGVDTLFTSVSLDLTLIGNTKFKGIEVIDISGGNTLTLESADIRTNNPLTDELFVDCSGANVTVKHSAWTDQGVQGNGYQLYTDNASAGGTRVKLYVTPACVPTFNP